MTKKTKITWRIIVLTILFFAIGFGESSLFITERTKYALPVKGIVTAESAEFPNNKFITDVNYNGKKDIIIGNRQYFPNEVVYKTPCWDPFTGCLFEQTNESRSFVYTSCLILAIIFNIIMCVYAVFLFIGFLDKIFCD
mgnify:CR=1 FL=1